MDRGKVRMRAKTGCIKVSNLFPIIGIALAAASCSIFNFLPLEIKDWSPKEELIDSVEGIVISVSFSSQVDKVKIESSFSLLENGKRLEGKYEWPESNSLKFIPVHTLMENAQYEIQVSTDCEDLNGNSLLKQFSHRFSTSSDRTRPEIISVSPNDESTVSGRHTPLVINFSEPVDKSSFYESFSVSPDISGSFEWASENSTVTFTPLEEYEYHTDYTVTVTEELKDLSFNTLNEDYIFKFSVGTDKDKPFILSTGESGGSLNLTADDPEDGILTVNSGWEADWNFTIIFNEDVDTDSLTSALDFSPAVNISMDNSGQKYLSQATLLPETRLEYGKTYKLSIDGSVKDREGNALEPLVYYFTVNGPNTKPPEITRIVFLEDPVSPFALTELNYGDTLSLANYPDSPGSTEGFFDIYISAADVLSVDMDELKLMVMSHFDISITNSAAEFITKGVVIDPESAGETPVPNPSPAADEIVVRVFMDISNSSGTAGIAELSLSEGFEDGNGNEIAGKWLMHLQKN